MTLIKTGDDRVISAAAASPQQQQPRALCAAAGSRLPYRHADIETAILNTLA